MTIVVMTGGSSGFGAIAVRHLAADTRLLVGARAAADLPLDLGRLDSVREFAATVRRRLGDERIDALVLNAGIIRPDADGRSADGYETTFAVNHLAHYLLIRLLLPMLADGARIVLTTSGTYDPATGAGLATPRHADADLLAHPDRDPGRESDPKLAGQHAYTASKLCAVLTACALLEQPDLRSRDITAVAFDPGQVFGTGLARDLAVPLRIAWSVFGTPLGAPLRWFQPTTNTRAAAGIAMADLVLGHDSTGKPTPRTPLVALRRGRLACPELSELARRDDLRQRLWSDSARLAGIGSAAAHGVSG
ncbi:SDR family NAD(P)-dependent oxidoreductase [Nocardia sp. NPDC050718]|uniref:SDR family NAD(P)-dependent oxidoreductase n=1 Tax=Nocardia sp. NPDC050718 TaxID=3155788 RepID=UPI0033D7F020